MHYWGDEWFKEHEGNFNKEIYWFHKYVRKFGKVKFSNKEKYGTHRTEFVQFWDGGLHYFFCKSYVRTCYPTLHYKIDPIIKFITIFSGIKWLFLKWQYFIWNRATQKVCKKHPEFTHEFVSDMDYYEIIKPIFGKGIDGEEIHNKYWKTIC